MLIEYYFDFSCPYAYLGASQIEALAKRTGAELVWRPMLLGGVFRSMGTPNEMGAGMGPAKARHNLLDMRRWADHFGVPLEVPAGHPMGTVRALRTLLGTAREHWSALIRSLYERYWVTGEDISNEQTLEDALADVGIDGDAASRALAANDDACIKAELRQRTDAAIARGVFGAPTVFVDADNSEEPLMFWGQDRLDLVEAALRGWRPGQRPSSATPRSAASAVSGGDADGDSERAQVIEFWYDFSSPFAYLGATQIEKVAVRACAKVVWRPMLLGAVFKAIGAPNAPMLAWSDAKRRYAGRELDYWSSHWQVDFRFSRHFPMRSVTALRLALLAGDRIAELSHSLFRAAWVDNLDIADEQVLARALGDLDFDASAMLARTKAPETKQRLIDNTSEAIHRSVFGAPTCIVGAETEPCLFWGQDRLGFVEKWLAGWPGCPA